VDGKAYAVSRQYDVLNRLTSLTYPDRTVVQYEYNPQGIESIKELFPTGTVPYVSNIDYTPTGQIIKIQYGNNTETNYTYDPDNLRLIHVNTLSPYGTIQNLAYQFDNIGNITQINDTINTATQSFSYDSLNRLIQAQGSYGSFNYAYDSIGNMIQKEGVTLSYGTSGRLPHAVRQYGNTAISYDANGNMISKGLSPAGGLSLTYDIENRLIKVTQTMSPTEAVPRSTINYPAIFSFTYDGDGGRVKKTIKVKGLSPQRTASEQNTIYIGSLFEKDSSGKTTRYIFSGSNRICAISQGLSPQGTIPRINYYHSDHLGSSNVITDNQGQQVGFTEFTPYGSTYKQTGSYDPKFKFTGKELDNTGLYFYGARYYDPQLGRFTSADTIVQAPYDPQSLNRYAYCRNNPINLVDPSGHSWWSKFWKGVGEFFENIFKNPIPFIASLFAAVVTSWAIAPMIKGLSGAMAVSGKGVTFWEGFILGGVEVGSPAFTGTLAASLAGGDKFSTAIKNAFIGGGITFVTAGLIEGAYAEGWQKVVHFQDVREDSVKAQIEKYNILENQGRFQEAMDVKTSLMKNYDFYADAKSNIIGRGIQHIDKVASKTTGEFAGIKFDWVGKESKLNWVRVLASDTINGKFSAIDRTTFISTNYRSLIFQSASPQVVDRAISIMPTLYGKEGNYILYGVGTFNCYNGAAEVDRRIRN
jgi:RHS repeat-associated protein